LPRYLLVPQGLERDRIIGAITHLQPEKVFIIRNKKQSSEMSAVEITVEEILNNLKTKLVEDPIIPIDGDMIDITTFKVNFFDLLDAYLDFRAIFSRLGPDAEFLVDISSGTRIVSCALFLAALEIGASIYYVSPRTYFTPQDTRKRLESISKALESYRETNEEAYLERIGEVLEEGLKEFEVPQLARGVRKVLKCPPLPIRIEQEEIEHEYLEALDDMGGKAPSITDLLVNLLGRKPTPTDRVMAAKQIATLERCGFVETAYTGRQKEINLTIYGKEWAEKATPS
jgi:hypothetical protein